MNIETLTQTSDLDHNSRLLLQHKFASSLNNIEIWKQKTAELIITNESQIDKIELAKEGYKFTKNIRIEIEKTRKILKENSLKEGRAIDLVAKTLTNEILPIELELEQKAKFIEIQAEKRKTARTQQRFDILNEIGLAIPSAELITEMSNEMFDIFVKGLQTDAEKNKQKQAELDKQALNEMIEIESLRKIQNAPDKEKIEHYVSEIKRMKIQELSTCEGHKLYNQIQNTIDNVLIKALMELENL